MLGSILIFKGLSDAQVALNRAEFGSNELPKRKKRNPFLIYLKYLSNLFSLMLMLAGLLSFVVFILSQNAFVHVADFLNDIPDIDY